MCRVILFIIIIPLFFLPIKGQITFNKQFDGGQPFLTITAVYPTDSCYYASGLYQGPQDGFLVIGNAFFKFDLQGNVLLQKNIGSPTKWYQTWRSDLISTGDKDFATLGITTRDGPPKGVLIKYNDQGDTLFTKEFLSPFYPEEVFIYAAELRSNNEDGFWALTGVDAVPNESNSEGYLLRIDNEGNISNEYVFENDATDTPISLLKLNIDGLIIGSRRSNLGQSGNNFFSRAHIFEINEEGELQWEYISPANQLINYPTNLISTPDGGLIAASGIGTELEVDSQTGYLLWFPYFFKLNSDHQLEWATEFRGLQKSTDFNIRDMAVASDNSGYVGISRISESESTGSEILGSWLMKVSPQGDSLWTRYYSVFDSLESEPTPYDIKSTPDGGYIISGYTSTNLDTTSLLRGWLLKVDEYGCLIPGCQGDYSSLEEEGVEQIELAIFPNPARDFLNFELRGQPPAAGAVFRVVNATGQVVKQIPAGQVWGTGMVPLQGWSQGVYWLQYVEAGRVRASEGFVVE